MKKLILVAVCLFLAACGDGSSTTPPTTQKTALLAVMGNFSTVPGEYPVSIRQSYSFFAGATFFNVSSISMSLKNNGTNQEYHFTTRSMANDPDPNPPTEYSHLSWTLLTADFTISPKPPAGIYTMQVVYNYPAAYGIQMSGSTSYTVE